MSIVRDKTLVALLALISSTVLTVHCNEALEADWIKVAMCRVSCFQQVIHTIY